MPAAVSRFFLDSRFSAGVARHGTARHGEKCLRRAQAYVIRVKLLLRYSSGPLSLMANHFICSTHATARQRPTGGRLEPSSAAAARGGAGPLPDGHGQERAVGVHLRGGARQEQEAVRRALQVCQDAAPRQEEGRKEGGGGGGGGRKWGSSIPAPRVRAKKVNMMTFSESGMVQGSGSREQFGLG